MSHKINTPIPKTVTQPNQGPTTKSGVVRQTSTENANKLKEENPLKKLESKRLDAKLTVKAFFQSIFSDKTIKDLKLEMKNEVKTKLLDRHDRDTQSKIKDIKGFKFESLATYKESKKFPFELASPNFKGNAQLLVSLHIGGFIDEAKQQGNTTKEDIRSFIASKLPDMMSRASLNDLMAFNRDAFLAMESNFREQGRTLKADIVHDLIEEFDSIMTKDGAVKVHTTKAVENINTAINGAKKDVKLAEEFLRNKIYDPVGIILFAHGFDDLNQHVKSKLGEILDVPGFSDIPVNAQLRNANFDGKHVATLEKAAEKVLEIIQGFQVPSDLKEKLEEFSSLISEKVNKNEISAELGKSLMHKFFNNAVILRIVNPSLTNAYASGSDTGKRLALVTQLVQAVLNDNDASKFANEETSQAYARVKGGLQNGFNQVLVEKFGMPDDVFARNEPPTVNNEPPTFEQYLAQVRRLPEGNPGNDGTPPINN